MVEISPGVNMELDSDGNLIGVEVFHASMMFKDVLKSMEKKLNVAEDNEIILIYSRTNDNICPHYSP